ncbi:hypothetical protein OM076_43145 [Solirubrobacter ginsenosidimutans]|uniref:Uncharacterized protein n=1 Tax=Solirubrobacter ginsenosidimutans TaxID=490573 RepID=A0A9X3N1Y0_9ACTN|nr:hypothetical protein [Solirubrobacter ginsenosidimutans]MDA0167136.1 hypothetical protein [Solirubrobacter ginsenosidimutans]
MLFGVKPGGAPWVISKGEAEARGDGSVKVAAQPGTQRHRGRGLYRRDRRVATHVLPGRGAAGQNAVCAVLAGVP